MQIEDIIKEFKSRRQHILIISESHQSIPIHEMENRLLQNGTHAFHEYPCDDQEKLDHLRQNTQANGSLKMSLPDASDKTISMWGRFLACPNSYFVDLPNAERTLNVRTASAAIRRLSQDRQKILEQSIDKKELEEHDHIAGLVRDSAIYAGSQRIKKSNLCMAQKISEHLLPLLERDEPFHAIVVVGAAHLPQLRPGSVIGPSAMEYDLKKLLTDEGFHNISTLDMRVDNTISDKKGYSAARRSDGTHYSIAVKDPEYYKSHGFEI